ncbi:CpaF family protein [Kitasatospora sp. NPDC059088]|uniref:CpaF family protein n=1 Tax=Kitasatospora sp. NPDC059088 TaxID=3346722 RepID=UPI00368BC559
MTTAVTLPVPVDQALVKRLREATGQLLQERRRRQEADGRRLTEGDLRAIAMDILASQLQGLSSERMNQGSNPLSLEDEESLTAAVLAALFGVGRLQPLLDDPDVENVDINGFDTVFVSYADGHQEQVGPIAESDDDLIQQIQVLAATSGLNSRPFDDSNPQLDIQLRGGHRMSAVMSFSHPRVVVSIRRKRLKEAHLSTLRESGTITPELEVFLRAAVRARMNIMIAGEVNAGKTTLLQALANAIPPQERLITIERALELNLHDFKHLHPNVVALEERLPNSEGHGRVSMAELVRRSLRMNANRVIVGEVLGDEVVAMLNAMSQGNDGSLSTIHANSSLNVFRKISTYAIQAAERLPVEASQMLISDAIELVIFVSRDTDPVTGRQRRRVVSVREVSGYADGRVLSSEVYSLKANDVVEWDSALTDRTRERLERHGFSADAYPAAGRWS